MSLEIVKKSFSLFGNQTVIKIDETPIEIHAGMDGCFFVAAKGPSSDCLTFPPSIYLTLCSPQTKISLGVIHWARSATQSKNSKL